MNDNATFVTDLLAAGMLHQADRRFLATVAVKTARDALAAKDYTAVKLFLDEALLQLGRAGP